MNVLVFRRTLKYLGVKGMMSTMDSNGSFKKHAHAYRYVCDMEVRGKEKEGGRDKGRRIR